VGANPGCLNTQMFGVNGPLHRCAPFVGAGSCFTFDEGEYSFCSKTAMVASQYLHMMHFYNRKEGGFRFIDSLYLRQSLQNFQPIGYVILWTVKPPSDLPFFFC